MQEVRKDGPGRASANGKRRPLLLRKRGEEGRGAREGDGGVKRHPTEVIVLAAGARWLSWRLAGAGGTGGFMPWAKPTASCEWRRVGRRNRPSSSEECGLALPRTLVGLPRLCVVFWSSLLAAEISRSDVQPIFGRRRQPPATPADLHRQF